MRFFMILSRLLAFFGRLELTSANWKSSKNIMMKRSMDSLINPKVFIIGMVYFFLVAIADFTVHLFAVPTCHLKVMSGTEFQNSSYWRITLPSPAFHLSSQTPIALLMAMSVNW